MQTGSACERVIVTEEEHGSGQMRPPCPIKQKDRPAVCLQHEPDLKKMLEEGKKKIPWPFGGEETQAEWPCVRKQAVCALWRQTVSEGTESPATG